MNRTLASGPIVWLGIIVTTCLILVLFKTVLWLVMPVLLAVVAYYLLSPLVNMAMARGITRPRAVLLVTLLLTIILAAIGSMIYPRISMMARNPDTQIESYIQTGTKLFNNAGKTVGTYLPFLANAPKPLPNSVGVVSIDTQPVTKKNELEDWLVDYCNKHASDLAAWIPSLFLVPYVTYFFLLDGPRFKRFLIQAIPNAFFEKTLYLFYRVEDQMRRYFLGLFKLTILDTVSLGVGLWVLGVSPPFFLAALAAVFAWLPYLGTLAGGIMVVLVAAHDSPDSPWLPYEVVALFIAVRLLDDFVFMPLTVGRSLQVHPLVTVLMIMLGGAVADIPGLLLVMPVLGVVMVAGQIIGELITDQRVLARHRHAKQLSLQRARIDLYAE